MSPARKDPARRSVSDWNRLTPTYRARLERAGVSRDRYLAGDSLQAARGHTPQPKGAAPLEATVREARGEGGPSDLEALERWAGSRLRPGWIPRDMSPPTAAALSQIDLPPSKWSSVRFTPRGDDQPWAMVVTPKGVPHHPDGSSPYDRVIEIPGGGAKSTWGAREVLDWLSYDYEGEDQIEWDVGESG